MNNNDNAPNEQTAQHLNQNSALDFRAELAKIQEIEAEPQNDNNDETNNSVTATSKTHSENAENSDQNEQEQLSDGDSKDIELDEENLPNMIPRGRFKKAIEKRKQLESELQLDRERLAKAEAEIKLYSQTLQKIMGTNTNNTAPEPEPFEPLDKEADNLYMKMINETKAELNAMKMHTMVTQQEAEFSKTNPDFDKAYDYVLNAQTKANNILCENENQAKEIALNQMRHMATRALQQGKNVAEMFYNIAKNYGYSTPSREVEKKPSANLDAIANNMKKSSTADVNTMSLEFNGGTNYSKMDNFNKAYDGKAETFHKMLNALKANR